MPWGNLLFRLPPYLPRAPAVGGYRSCFWQSCLNSAMPLSRTPQGCPQVYGSACARIYYLPALSLRSGLPKPFQGRRLSLGLSPSSRRLPCRWASRPTRAVNSCTVYSVVNSGLQQVPSYTPFLRPFFQRSFLSNNIIHRLFTIIVRKKRPCLGRFSILALYPTFA